MEKTFVGFDLETQGDEPLYALQPFRASVGRAKITSFALWSEKDGLISSGLNPRPGELSEELARVYTREGNIIVGWNVLFDLSFVLAAGIPLPQNISIIDAQVLRRLVLNSPQQRERGFWSLKRAVQEEFPEHADYAKDVDFGRTDEALLRYNELDAKFTALLARHYYEKLNDCERRCAQIRCAELVAIASALVRGIPLDEAAIATAIEEKNREVLGILAECDVPAETLRSPQRLRALLDNLGVRVDSTDKRTLAKHSSNDLIRKIQRAREAANEISKVLSPARNTLEYTQTGAAHPHFRLWNSYTGRCGYSSTLEGSNGKRKVSVHLSPPLHQIKRNLRKIIVAPKGMAIVECDYNAQESRLLAALSRDPTLQKLFAENKDFHAYMGAQIASWDYATMVGKLHAGDEEAKRYRTLGKIANLSLAYRTSAETLCEVARTNYGVEMSTDEARRLHGLFRLSYPAVPNYWRAQIRSARSRGFVETISGARCYLEYSADDDRAWGLDQTAINYPVQGSGADLKFAALALIMPYVRQAGGQFFFELHDALFFLFPEDRAREAGIKLKELFNEIDYSETFGFSHVRGIHFPIEAKVGPAWGEMKAI